MAEPENDVKPTAEESSTTADVKQETSAESSTAEGKDVKQPASLAEAVEQAAASHREADESTPEAKADDAVDAQTETETKPEAKAEPAEGKNEEEVNVPFAKHPRWQEVMGELKELRPLAQRAKEFESKKQSMGVSDDQLQEMLEIGALMQQNPKAALERLQPYIQQLETYQGIRLPSDLQKKVDDGLIDADTATEVAQLRAQREHRERQAVQDRTTQERMSVNTALAAWEQSQQKIDPSFKDRFDLVKDRFVRLYHSTEHDKSAQAVVKLAAQADADVKKAIAAHLPALPMKDVLTTKGSTKSKEPASWQEAAAAAGARYRQ